MFYRIIWVAFNFTGLIIRISKMSLQTTKIPLHVHYVNKILRAETQASGFIQDVLVSEAAVPLNFSNFMWECKIFVDCRTYHFLCNPKEPRNISDHISKAVIYVHTGSKPWWKLSHGIRGFKPGGHIIAVKSICRQKVLLMSSLM